MHTNRQTKGHRQNNRGIQTSGQRDTDRTTRIQTGKGTQTEKSGEGYRQTDKQRDTRDKQRDTDRQTEGHRQTKTQRERNGQGIKSDKEKDTGKQRN